MSDLPEDFEEHTQSGLVICGGNGNVQYKCFTFGDGVWNRSHHLIHHRYFQLRIFCNITWKNVFKTIQLKGWVDKSNLKIWNYKNN